MTYYSSENVDEYETFESYQMIIIYTIILNPAHVELRDLFQLHRGIFE